MPQLALDQRQRDPLTQQLVSSSQPRLLGSWRSSSQMPYRSISTASDVDLARFDLRIIRAMQSSGRAPHDG